MSTPLFQREKLAVLDCFTTTTTGACAKFVQFRINVEFVISYVLDSRSLLVAVKVREFVLSMSS